MVLVEERRQRVAVEENNPHAGKASRPRLGNSVRIIHAVRSEPARAAFAVFGFSRNPTTRPSLVEPHDAKSAAASAVRARCNRHILAPPELCVSEHVGNNYALKLVSRRSRTYSIPGLLECLRRFLRTAIRRPSYQSVPFERLLGRRISPSPRGKPHRKFVVSAIFLCRLRS